MTEQGPQPMPPPEPAVEAQRLAGTVLVRIAVEPADEALVARDLATLLGSKGTGDVWRIEVGRLVAALVAGGLVERDGAILRATPSGTSVAQEFLGARKGLPSSWDKARDINLVAVALGLDAAPAARLKMLRKADGLRALIVAQHWKLAIKGQPSPSRLRSALAVKALERAFGNQVGTGMGDKSSLPSKAGRLLASQLSTSGREFGTDGRLVAALAAEAVGSRRGDAKSLQLALLRRFLGRPEEPSRKRRPARLGRRGRLAAERLPPPTAHASSEDLPPQMTVAPSASVPPASPGPPPPAHDAENRGTRPDPASFAEAVLAATDETAEGWAGNRKAYISKVWAVMQRRHAAWSLSEIEFKCMLTEAHRAGLIALANADLKDKRALGELQESAVVYKNTVWHYVRAAE